MPDPKNETFDPKFSPMGLSHCLWLMPQCIIPAGDVSAITGSVEFLGLLAPSRLTRSFSVDNRDDFNSQLPHYA